MRISADIKRILQTTIVTSTACVLVFLLIKETVPTTISIYHVFSAFLFSVSIPSTNKDKIYVKDKSSISLYILLLMTLQLTILSDGGIFIGLLGFGEFYYYSIGPIGGLLTLQLYKQFVRIENVKFGSMLTVFITLIAPFLIELLKKFKIMNAANGDHSEYLIIWQILTGLAIAISIWIKKGILSKDNRNENASP